MPSNFESLRQNIVNTIIFTYLNIYLGRENPEYVIECLHRLLRLKKEVLDNLTTFALKQINEKNRNQDDVVNTLSFYAVIFHDYINKNNGQPIKPYE